LGGRLKGLLLIPALMAAVVVYAVFDTDSGIRTLLQVRANVVAADGRIDAIEREIASLRQQAAVLEDDSFAIESAIRADLALVRPGEQVVRLSGAEDSNPRFP
jgi:cell division protein FtsB